MQIELPAPSWSDAPRAHDDAHTLTVPPQRGVSLVAALVPGAQDGPTARCEVAAAPGPTLTLTL